MSRRERIEIPARPKIDEALPAWVTDELGDTSEWERHHVARAWRNADRDLRDSIDRLATVLDRLHSKEWTHDTAMHNAVGSAASSAFHLGLLEAARDGIIHRHALDRDREDS